MHQSQFHLIIYELLEWHSGEAGVGEDYVGGWFILVVLILGDVVRGELDTEAMDHHALRHTKGLSNFQELFG